MKRNQILTFACILLAFLLIAGCAAPAAAASATSDGASAAEETAENEQPVQTEPDIVTLDILAHSDFAGSIEASEYYAGSAKLAAYIEAYRAKNPNGTFVLSCGDDLVGAPISSLLKGKPVIEIMNKIGYDAMTIGNHEFDWGMETTGETLKTANFPLLLANVYEKATGERIGFTKPYVIIEKQGVKVGILGLITQETPKITLASSVEPYEFRDPIEEANELIPIMKSEGAEIIVALTHMPAYAQTDGSFAGEVIDFANAVQGVDAIIAGHNFDPMCIDVNGVPVIQTTHNGSQLSHLVLTYDRAAKQLVSATAEPIDVLAGTLDVQPDAEVAGMVANYTAELGTVFEEVLGTATEDLTIGYVDEFSIGDWWTDGIRSATGAQFAFINSSGIFETIPAGPITLGKLYSVSPFENNLVVTDMTGAQIKELFEISYNSARIQEMGALQISGLVVTYDLSKPDGEKVVSVALEDGTPVNDDTVVSTATINFLATGGNDYTNLTALKWNETGILARDAFAAQMRGLGEISNATHGRLIAIG